MSSLLFNAFKLHAKTANNRTQIKLWPCTKMKNLIEQTKRCNRTLCTNTMKKVVTESLENETFGQPTSVSHPHLLKTGEINPGIGIEEIVDRRHRLLQNILKINPKGNNIIVVSSAKVQYMTEKIPYVFRQNTDFRYLTGCLEPDSVLVLIANSDKNMKSMIFVREKNKHSELWEGPRTGVEKARDMFHVDESWPADNLQMVLNSNCKNSSSCTLWFDFSEVLPTTVNKGISAFLAEKGSKEIKTVKEEIHKLRLIKSNSEQILMKKSAEIASNAIIKAMQITKPNMTEHQLFATVDYHCRMNGAEFLAYPPVVAAGNNANIIHYINNTQQIQDGEMVLMDAGCELHGYCSDITRTWPVNGTFNDYQRVLYEIVYNVQDELIKNISKFNYLDALFEKMCKLLGHQLREAHVLSKSSLTDSLDAVAFKLCPHHVGHYLGMDVHDTGSITRKTQLVEGMVVTIEPGLYINKFNELTKPEFRGYGIRIEDDILITSSGPYSMSICPKRISDVEKICQS